jgi:hypothetical protein
MATKLRCRLGKHEWRARGRGDALTYHGLVRVASPLCSAERRFGAWAARCSTSIGAATAGIGRYRAVRDCRKNG